MITAKLVRIGSAVKEYGLNSGASAGDLFKAAGLSDDTSGATRRGQPVNQYTALFDGDVIFIGDKIKGNTDTVKFVILGSSVAEFPYEAGMTIGQVIDGLGAGDKGKYVNADGSDKYEYRVGSGTGAVDRTYILNGGTSEAVKVFLSQKTKGNK